MPDIATQLAATATLNRYFRLLDERRFDAAAFRAVFADDGSVVRPNGTSLVGPQAIADGHRESFRAFPRTQHVLSGHVVEANDVGVTVRADLLAMHLRESAAHGVVAVPDDYFLAGGVITAELVPLDDAWRIRRVVNDNVWKAGSGFAGMAAIGKRP